MTTSGCANSEDGEGTSLPTKGTASLRRLRGICGSSSSAAAESASLSRPKETRFTLARQCGRKVLSQSCVRLSSFLCVKEGTSVVTLHASSTLRRKATSERSAEACLSAASLPSPAFSGDSSHARASAASRPAEGPTESSGSCTILPSLSSARAAASLSASTCCPMSSSSLAWHALSLPLASATCAASRCCSASLSARSLSSLARIPPLLSSSPASSASGSFSFFQGSTPATYA
mmetsp:Transcript_3700/g.12955  ORF Transcript_3700/g.12955 Transcript_3700/m.12955 type:complete len:234 (+) Transcript_3700:1199-1900(+)